MPDYTEVLKLVREFPVDTLPLGDRDLLKEIGQIDKFPAPVVDRREHFQSLFDRGGLSGRVAPLPPSAERTAVRALAWIASIAFVPADEEALNARINLAWEELRKLQCLT